MAPDHTKWHPTHTNTHTHIQTHGRAKLDEVSVSCKHEKAKYSHDTNIHAVSGIRTRHPSNRAGADSLQVSNLKGRTLNEVPNLTVGKRRDVYVGRVHVYVYCTLLH